MSVCLRYLWIKEYSCLKNVNFQFDEKYEFNYVESKNCLNIKSCKIDPIENFWDGNERFMNIHAVVGSNGYGKTTFLRAIMAIFCQIYPPKDENAEIYKHSAYTYPALMIVEDQEKQVYKLLCMGIKIAKYESEIVKDIDIVYDKMQIRDTLYKVKLAFFSNAFDYRDYNEAKAEHISDYSFGGLLKGDYSKQVYYQRDDRYDDPVSEQFYHNIYRQVSFMTEFYAGLCDEDQKRMFQSWPERLQVKFRERRGEEKEKLCFHGVFVKVLKQYVVESDMHAGGHGVSAYFFVEKRLERLLCNKQSELDKTYDKIRYRLCRESFQNLLNIDAYRSFYQTPDEKKLGKELEPIAEIICSVIDQFGDAKNEQIDFQAGSIFKFYECLQKLLERDGGRLAGRVGTIASYYAEMFKLILSLPEKIFRYENFDKTEEFYFEIRKKETEYTEQFSKFLNQYKKIVLPFSFLGFDWRMSSGENNMLSLYAQIFAMREVEEGTNYHTKRILNYIRRLKEKEQSIVFDVVPSDTVWFLMDEADLTFHPAWQVEFISNITYFFPKILPDRHLKLQVVFTTHSPILLGDMPGQNVIYMVKKGNDICSSRNFSKNTFGQNIYMLFQDSMVVEDDMPDKKISEIEEARIVLWKYPELYRFLYLAPERAALPRNKEEVTKRPVYKDRLKQLLIGRHDKMTEGNRRKCLADIIGEIGKLEEGAPELLGKIFRYDKFAYSAGAKRILKMLGITVCPYCNRMFITTIERSDTKNRWKGTRPQFDHYFNKDRYPYLAVNFYNLIPSCSSCNQYKHELDTYEEPLLYPYDEGMGQEYVFAAYPVGYNWGIFYENINDRKEDIKLFIEPKPINIYKNKAVSASERIELEQRIQTSVNRLHLEDLYNMHTDYAAQIIRNGYLFNDAYIRMLSERFPKMKFSMHDVKEFLYCKNLSEEQWGQNILAKLAYDMDAGTDF